MGRVKADDRIPRRPINVLVVDVGGTNVKILVNGKRKPRKQARPAKVLRLWTHTEATKALPYIHSVVSSVRTIPLLRCSLTKH
jgi:hypothetical protein